MELWLLSLLRFGDVSSRVGLDLRIDVPYRRDVFQRPVPIALSLDPSSKHRRFYLD